MGCAMYRRVVLPQDGSAVAREALPHAAALARQFEAPVYILSAWEGPDKAAPHVATNQGELDRHAWQELHAPTSEAAIAHVQKMLDEPAAPLRARGIDVAISILDVLAGGSPAGAILESAHREADTIIVMTTHGRGGLTRMVFGSTANDVVQNAAVPVLLIRAVQDG